MQRSERGEEQQCCPVQVRVCECGEGGWGGLVTFYTQMLHDSLPRGGEETEGQETIPPFLELRVKKLRNVGEVKDKT